MRISAVYFVSVYSLYVTKLFPEEQLTGLLAEPSLKHFDQNIINLIESEVCSISFDVLFVRFSTET